MRREPPEAVRMPLQNTLEQNSRLRSQDGKSEVQSQKYLKIVTLAAATFYIRAV